MPAASLAMPDIAFQYLPILLFIGVGIAFSLIFVGAPVLVSKLTGTSQPDAAKLSEYESGFPAFSDSRAQFDVRFYLVSILFIVFDLEAAYLFPWAVSLHWTGVAGWGAMMQFLGELAIGLIYAWKAGALDWE
jgi:NADH-quinone oxidoreductase subunit A